MRNTFSSHFWVFSSFFVFSLFLFSSSFFIPPFYDEFFFLFFNSNLHFQFLATYSLPFFSCLFLHHSIWYRFESVPRMIILSLSSFFHFLLLFSTRWRAWWTKTYCAHETTQKCDPILAKGMSSMNVNFSGETQNFVNKCNLNVIIFPIIIIIFLLLISDFIFNHFTEIFFPLSD